MAFCTVIVGNPKAFVNPVVKAMCCNISYEKPRSAFATWVMSFLSETKKEPDGSVRIVAVAAQRHVRYAAHLVKRFYHNAKIVFFSPCGEVADLADLIVTPYFYMVPDIYLDKLVTYSCPLSFNKLDNIDIDISGTENDPIFMMAKSRSVAWVTIGFPGEALDVSASAIDNFCDSLLKFVNTNGYFMCIAFNIKNKNIASVIRNRVMSESDCYVLDMSVTENLRRYYGLLTMADYVVHFGINMVRIAWLMSFKKFLYVFDDKKTGPASGDMLVNNVVFYNGSENIPSPIATTLPTNDIDGLVAAITNKLGL